MAAETTSSFNPEVHRGQIVDALRRSMADGEHGLNVIPNLVKRAEKAKVWRTRIVKATGRTVAKNNFRELVEATPPEGLGGTIDLLRGLCRDDQEARDAIDRMTQRPAGGQLGNQNNSAGANQHTQDAEGKRTTDDNVNIRPPAEPKKPTTPARTSPTGTSKDQALRRLRKDRPDLHARVMDEEDRLTPHAAMVEAGFRPKTGTFYPEDIERTARVLANHFDPDELYEAMKVKPEDLL